MRSGRFGGVEAGHNNSFRQFKIRRPTKARRNPKRRWKHASLKHPRTGAWRRTSKEEVDRRVAKLEEGRMSKGRPPGGATPNKTANPQKQREKEEGGKERQEREPKRLAIQRQEKHKEGERSRSSVPPEEQE
ncbi:hypothetical protein CJ030_MR0G009070 [Morella rubra]|uniref:Uncharacterized protein n=1 Tax=Morella rubra TaxID=262757 RepID=A0A6A1UH73_9ROSI|nr:hypothetical protein CJ030_MR0G009070 [Morella rubra]